MSNHLSPSPQNKRIHLINKTNLTDQNIDSIALQAIPQIYLCNTCIFISKHAHILFLHSTDENEKLIIDLFHQLTNSLPLNTLALTLRDTKIFNLEL